LHALRDLGLNRAWPLSLVAERLREIMTDEFHTDPETGVTAWDKYKTKQMKSGTTIDHYLGRILSNMKSFRRLCKDREGRVGMSGLNPYGYRLWQLHCAVDIFIVRTGRGKAKKAFIRLNTYSNDPLLEYVGSEEEIERLYPVRRLAGRTLGPLI
jgi:hypothetical protein